MKRMWQRGRMVAVVMVLIMAITGTALASQLDQTKNHLQQVQDEIRQQQQLINQTRTQERNLTAELNSLEQAIDKLENDLAALDRRLKQNEQLVSKTEKELELSQQQLDERISILNQRLVDIYQNGNVSYLEVLLGANSFSDFITRLDFLQRVVDHDVTLFEEVKAEKERLEAKREELERKKREIIAMKTEASNKKNERERQVSARGKLLAEIRDDRATQQKYLDELERTSRELESTIRQLQGNSGSSQVVGKMAWPVPYSTRVTSPFGMRRHPILNTMRMHTGIDIAGRFPGDSKVNGQNIVSAEAGKVILSSWLTGYGNTVIVDHGGGITTLYAHCSSRLVSVGQTVKKGQVIARVGSTGSSTAPHLHFEVRVNGTPKNPMDWL